MYGYESEYGYYYGGFGLIGWEYDYGPEYYGYWYERLQNELNEHVVVVLTAGDGYSAVSGVLGRVYPRYIILIDGFTVIEIPMNRIVAVRKVAGGVSSGRSRSWEY